MPESVIFKTEYDGEQGIRQFCDDILLEYNRQPCGRDNAYTRYTHEISAREALLANLLSHHRKSIKDWKTGDVPAVPGPPDADGNPGANLYEAAPWKDAGNDVGNIATFEHILEALKLKLRKANEDTSNKDAFAKLKQKSTLDVHNDRFIEAVEDCEGYEPDHRQTIDKYKQSLSEHIHKFVRNEGLQSLRMHMSDKNPRTLQAAMDEALLHEAKLIHAAGLHDLKSYLPSAVGSMKLTDEKMAAILAQPEEVQLAAISEMDFTDPKTVTMFQRTVTTAALKAMDAKLDARVAPIEQKQSEHSEALANLSKIAAEIRDANQSMERNLLQAINTSGAGAPAGPGRAPPNGGYAKGPPGYYPDGREMQASARYNGGRCNWCQKADGHVAMHCPDRKAGKPQVEPPKN